MFDDEFRELLLGCLIETPRLIGMVLAMVALFYAVVTVGAFFGRL